MVLLVESVAQVVGDRDPVSSTMALEGEVSTSGRATEYE